jgi:glycosyltransferase involved in cell wall biosynthesis
MGLPVVAFDLAETRFSAEEAALYASPNDIGDFARNIETLLDDETLRRTMGTIGRRRIEEALSWEYDRKNLTLAYHTLFPGSALMNISNRRG